MASTQFLEEALNTDVDETTVNALVGSLENQLVPAAPVATPAEDTSLSNQGNNGIANGGILVQKQTFLDEEGKSLTALQNASTVVLGGPNVISKSGDGLKIVTFPSSGQVVNINNRVSYPNGTVPTTAGNVIKVESGQPTPGTTYVIKAPGSTPMTAGSPQHNPNKPVLSQGGNTVQILNVNSVRPGAPQKGMQQQRLVVNSQPVIRPGGNPAFTLQTLQGLQQGPGGHILVKTETGQLQLIRVGPAQPTGTATTVAGQPQNAQFRIQSVSLPQAASSTVVVTTSAGVASSTQPPTLTATTPAQRQQVDTTKEKCRKFLANLLELSSREPKAVERNVRTLIQELIDAKVEPEEFCDRLEKLLNASPQPCLIGFLKKSLPLLRQSLFLRVMSIDGIRPPPQHVVATPVVSGAPMQPGMRPQMLTQTVRVVAPINAAGQNLNVTTPRLQQRLITPIRPGMAGHGKVLTTLGTSTHPPPLQPTAPLVRMAGQARGAVRIAPGTKPPVRPPAGKVAAMLPVNKSLSKAVRGGFDSSGFGGDDDINDVAAMGGVNLAEESQRILGSTEFVGTQIRSVKDELFLHSIPLQNKIRQIVSSHGLEDASGEVVALISHACQERLKTLLEKLASIAEHRIDVIKLDPRYEATQDVKSQIKFLEELDRQERKRHEEQERELLLRAAKSRSKSEDPEQVKLKAKAKEMQRAEMEEMRQREANITALKAIGPRKKPRLDGPGTSESIGASGSGFLRPQVPLRPRLKRVNLRDVLFLLEQEREPARTKLLYRTYLK